MPKPKCRWSSGGRWNVAADVAYEELQRIKKSGRDLTASVVVSEAKPTNAPLHPAFEWDDTKAAVEWRMRQARVLMRDLVIIEEVRDDMGGVTKKPLHVVIHAPSPSAKGEGSYHFREEMATNAELWARAYEEAVRLQLGAERSVQELKTLAKRAGKQSQLATLVVAMEAMKTARCALQKVH